MAIVITHLAVIVTLAVLAFLAILVDVPQQQTGLNGLVCMRGIQWPQDQGKY